MRIVFFATFFVLLGQLVLAQETKDSVRSSPANKLVSAADKIDSAAYGINSLTMPGDSTSKAALHKADSIRANFQSSVDSLQMSYQKPINKMDSVSRRLQHKLDSLQSLRLPTDKLMTKYKAQLDSVTHAKTQKLTELNQKVEASKAKAMSGLKEINMPPPLQGPVQNLEKSIQGYKIPMINGKIPNLNASYGKLPPFRLSSGNLNTGSLGNVKLPGVGVNNPLNNIAAETKGLSNATGQIIGYTKDVKNIANGDLGEVRNLDKKAENEAMNLQGMGELKSNTAQINKYKNQMKGRPDSAAMAMGKSEVIKEATNHFKGQEAVLQQAMDKMTKLKTKYTGVKSMAELPKKLPNPLHDKPFVERLIPGINFQIFNRGHFLLDVNVVAVYRITPRLSAGTGWVERLGFPNTSPSTDRVYGPRSVVRVDWTKGFSFSFQPEVLNTFVPPQLIQAAGVVEGQREWVWSAFVGMKKDFTVYKRIRGNTEVLYNLYNPQSKSPYPDRLSVRFGFEFPLQRRSSARK